MANSHIVSGHSSHQNKTKQNKQTQKGWRGFTCSPLAKRKVPAVAGTQHHTALKTAANRG